MNIFQTIGYFIKKIFTKDFTTNVNAFENLPPITEDFWIMSCDNEARPIIATISASSTTTTTTTTLKVDEIKIVDSTIKHLEEWEHRDYTVYDDSKGFLTIGIGHVIFDKNEIFDNKKLIDLKLTDEQVDRLLYQDLYKRVKAIEQIKQKITVKLNQNQIDAIVLFIFNTGTLWNVLATAINLYLSNELSLKDFKSKWRYYRTSKGSVMAGLINRREGELDLFLNEYKGRNYYTKSKTINKNLIIGYY